MPPPTVLLYCAAPKADAGGVQGVVGGLAESLGDRAVTAWPDGEEGPREWRLPLTVDLDQWGRVRLGAAARAVRDLAALTLRLARLRPDVVNLHFPRGQTAYFFALRRVFGYRIVLSLHGSDLRRPTGAVARRLPGWIASADAVTAVSAPLAEEAAAMGGRPVACVPNGVDTAFWTPGEALPREGLLAAGRLVSVKGFDVLLEALGRVRTTVPLTLAGQGAEEAALRARASRLGLDGRVTFAGHLGRVALRDAYRRAALVVMPSRDEGLPLGLLEALACGAPCLASDVGGVGAVLAQGGGWTVPPDDPDALAARLDALAADPAALRAAREAAPATAARYAASESNAAYARVFAQACSQ